MSTTDTLNPENDLVNFPIPSRFYAFMVQTLAALIKAESASSLDTGCPLPPPSAPEPPPPSILTVPLPNGYTLERLRKFKLLAADHPTAIAFMDLITETPNRRFGMEEICERAKRTHRQVNADFAKFTRVLAREFPDTTKWKRWPNHYAQVNGRYKYFATEAVAEAWKAA